jgi:hypothetical protein
LSRQIPKPEWQAYFDSISETMAGSVVELDVATLGLADQLEAEWVEFEGIAYDPADDFITFVLQDLDRRRCWGLKSSTPPGCGTS